MNSHALDSARAMEPLMLELRDETERNRRLPEPVVAALVRAGLCRMALPRALGGLALSPVEALGVYETLSRSEASVPWIAFNNALVCLFSRFMGQGLRKDVFGDPGALFAQSTRPSGIAIEDGPGYRVSGRWSLVSGCELADWFFLLCVVESESGPPPSDGDAETRFLFVRRSEAEIIDTWHVGGLRGSGSHDVAVHDLHVPRERAVTPATPPTAEEPIERLPITCNLSAIFAAQTLGVAQACVDALVSMAQDSPPTTGGAGLNNRPDVQTGVTLHGAGLTAARAHLHGLVEALWEDALAGRAATLKRIGETYGAALHACTVASGAVDAMYALAGTRGLYSDRPFERAHRDLHAMLRHVLAQPLWAEDAGRVTFGMKVENPLYAL